MKEKKLHLRHDLAIVFYSCHDNPSNTVLTSISSKTKKITITKPYQIIDIINQHYLVLLSYTRIFALTSTAEMRFTRYLF